jgi:hypothetical protein
LLLTPLPAGAGVGDPQVRTDHPWYAGELTCSTFERLFARQAELYRRVVGVEPRTDEQKALASWFWRNAHYYHAEEGAQDLFGKGFGQANDLTRDYWTGLFAFGFGLCYTTHAQWSAEMDQLLGHARGRSAEVEGHTSFEVFLKGGCYGDGKWVLLDHDISTVIFDPGGTRLLSIPEIKTDLRVTQRRYRAERQHGWLVSGLHPIDAPGVYTRYSSAAYLAGYAGPPPRVHLRRGETLRRYHQPGLEDGKTFVFWGRNYNRGLPGPERDLTWVNQPEKMHGSRTGTAATVGQARYGNALYIYRPDFASDDYREGVVEEDGRHVTFEFATPYIIAATPPNASVWGVYDPGCTNGLVLRGKARCPVTVSVDRGRTWHDCGTFRDGMDLTDHVKGQQQYFVRFGSGASGLAGTGLTLITVCQVNAAVLPRLRDGGSLVHFEASGQANVAAGPAIEQARTHLVGGGIGTPEVRLELATPRGEPACAVYAAAHVASGNPPDPEIRYFIDHSTDGGKTWAALVQDWRIPRRGEEPGDFWSQSFCYGSAPLPPSGASRVQVRFHNTGKKAYLRAELHCAYQIPNQDATRVTFAWRDDTGSHRAGHVFSSGTAADRQVPTGRNVQMGWVEFTPVASSK